MSDGLFEKVLDIAEYAVRNAVAVLVEANAERVARVYRLYRLVRHQFGYFDSFID